MNDEKKSLNLNKIFFAGGVALSTSFAVMHPLDTMRVHIQSSSKNKFRLSNFKNLYRFSSRGFFPSGLMSFPQGAIRLGTYEYSKEHLSGYLPLMINSATCAVLGDLSSSVVKIPKELITQKIQTGQHTNTRQVLKEIFMKKNFLSLYRGTASTVMRDVPFMVSLFSSYDFIKYQKSQREQGGRKMTTTEFTLMGGLSGGWAGFLTTPCDVIKTRIMTSKNPNQNITNSMIELLQENGFKSLFRGAAYRTTWWFSVCSIFFPIYETLKNY
jgi:solute carrier family 25 S-adenosylmethionine transporter 26